MASGTTASQLHSRASGRSLRSVSQASVTATTIDAGTARSSSSTVFTRSSPTRGRKISSLAVSHPVPTSTTSTKPTGISAKAATATAAAMSAGCAGSRRCRQSGRPAVAGASCRLTMSGWSIVLWRGGCLGYITPDAVISATTSEAFRSEGSTFG